MIRLTKDKAIYTNHYQKWCAKYVEKEVFLFHPFLDEVVELSDDFTLEDLFYWIGRNQDHFDLIFCSQLGNRPLQCYLDEVQKPYPEKDDEIEYLELQRFGELWDWGDIDLFISFSGIGKGKGINYALEFTPLNEIKHLPLKLNKKFVITTYKKSTFFSRLVSKLRRKGNNSYVTLVEGETDFTLYELIGSVLSEVSFVGTPEERDTKLDEIEEDVEEMKRVASEEKGTNDHFEHAKKIIKSWPKWKQDINCNPCHPPGFDGSSNKGKK